MQKLVWAVLVLISAACLAVLGTHIWLVASAREPVAALTDLLAQGENYIVVGGIGWLLRHNSAGPAPAAAPYDPPTPGGTPQ